MSHLSKSNTKASQIFYKWIKMITQVPYDYMGLQNKCISEITNNKMNAVIDSVTNWIYLTYKNKNMHKSTN